MARFRADCARLTGQGDGAGSLALAVSGGPDSMAMLALASAAFPGRVIAATVDHGLRAESAREAAMVARYCATLGVDHAILRIETPRGTTGNLHAWARRERYALLKRWAVDRGAGCLCTAHHAEDQAETFLMRAARSSGLSGLAAVRARTEDRVALRDRAHTENAADRWTVHVAWAEIVVLRPLLGWRRAELRAVAEMSSLPFVDDPSNGDDRFDRTRFRLWLEQAPWIDPVQIATAAGHIADAEADLLAVSRWLWTQRALPCTDDEARFDVADLPRGVRRYMARMAIDAVALVNGMPVGGPDRVGNVEPLLDALEACKGATHAGVRASAKGTIWRFREAAPRRVP